MKYPWEAPFYFPKGDYGDITFDYAAPDYQGFPDGTGPNPPCIVRVSRDPFNLSGPRMYFHNLAFRDLIGTQCMTEVEVVYFDIDFNHLYDEDGFPIVICDMTDADGLTVAHPLQTVVVEGKLAVTMTEDIIQWAYEHIGMRGFTEWHVGHIG